MDNNKKSKFSQNTHLFRCPICHSKMQMDGEKSLKCRQKHCFDISKKGYINLLTNNVKPGYDKEMFEARRKVADLGFFEEMLNSIERIIFNQIKNQKDELFILDAGCGEGSHLSRLWEKLNRESEIKITGAGIDISKEVIKIASRYQKDIIWVVADLANTPFLDKKFDIILNILSPSNYAEFNRLLKDDGILIKVVPGSNYLAELRRTFYGKTNKETYSNDKIIAHCAENFKIVDIQEILYSFAVKGEKLDLVIRMTPLSWGVPSEAQYRAKSSEMINITVDLTLIVGKKY